MRRFGGRIVSPEWAAWPMAAVTRLEAQAWVDRLRATRRARHLGRPVQDGEEARVWGAATIAAAVHLMTGLYRLAMREHPPLVTVNPFADLELPTIEPHSLDFYERDEAAALYQAAGAIDLRWRALTELGMDVGLRPGEMFGLHGHRVDWLRGQIAMVDVMTRQGLRQYPKSRKSHRVVPVPPATLEGLSVLMTGRPRDALVFTAPGGGPVNDVNFRNRVWQRAVSDARLCSGRHPAPDGGALPSAPKGCDDPLHSIRPFPPRIMRHTAASWLVMDGVPLYDVQALLGHESFATTQRYAHLAPEAHSRVIESWSRHRDASPTHGTGVRDAR